MEEFNLSKKIMQRMVMGEPYGFLTLDDVKEFIRLLKKGCSDWHLEELIDKLAGDKLI